MSGAQSTLSVISLCIACLDVSLTHQATDQTSDSKPFNPNPCPLRDAPCSLLIAVRNHLVPWALTGKMADDSSPSLKLLYELLPVLLRGPLSMYLAIYLFIHPSVHPSVYASNASIHHLSVWMCVCVCIFTCICIFICTCRCICICVHVYVLCI